MAISCYIFAEKETPEGVEFIGLLSNLFIPQSYRVFAFLADIANDSCIPPISTPRGVPHPTCVPDDNFFNVELYGWSWMTIQELIKFNYDQEIEDLVITNKIAKGISSTKAIAMPGQGTKTTYRKFLGEHFFTMLHKLESTGATRIVVCFEGAKAVPKETYQYIRTKELPGLPVGFVMRHPSPPSDGWKPYTE